MPVKIEVTPDQVMFVLKSAGIRIGYWQKAVIRGREDVRGLKGKAKSYTGRYTLAYCNLLEKLEKAGIAFRTTKGKRGGWLGGLHSEHYTAYILPEVAAKLLTVSPKYL